MKEIKIAFKQFWTPFDKEHNFITDILRKYYIVNVVDDVTDDVDLVIVSVFAYDMFDTSFYGRVKTLEYSPENTYPDFNHYDYSIGMTDIKCERYLRVPLWSTLKYEPEREYARTKFSNEPNITEEDFYRKQDDIPMVVSTGTRSGVELIDAIGANFNIVSGGGWRNTTGYRVPDKIEFLSNYKFSFALENSIGNGYVTEKIFDSFAANTIPIFYGHDCVKNDFNEKAFFLINEQHDVERCIKDIDAVMHNKDHYLDMANQKRIINYVDYDARIAEFLVNIIENGKIYNHKYGFIGRWLV